MSKRPRRPKEDRPHGRRNKLKEDGTMSEPATPSFSVSIPFPDPLGNAKTRRNGRCYFGLKKI